MKQRALTPYTRSILFMFVAALLLVIFPAAAQTASADAGIRNYYYMGDLIPIEVAPEVIAVSLRDGTVDQQMTAINRMSPFLMGSEATTYPNFMLIHINGTETRDATRNTAIALDTVDQLRDQTQLVEWANPVFRVPAGYAILTDELIVQFPAEWDDAQIGQFSAERSLEIVSELLSNDNTFLLRMTLPSGSRQTTDAMALANSLQESRQVIYAEPNLVTFFEDRLPPASETPAASRDFVPNDTFFSQQWALNNTGQTVNGVAAGTPDADIDAVEAWDITRGSSNIIIAIFDDAFDPTHVDLGTGTSKMVLGYDAPSGQGDIVPAPGGLTAEAHGTATAGLAAANGNNGQGISGVCQNCRLMPIDIFNGDPIATNSQLANAFNYAWQHGADVLSNSWGGLSPTTTVTNAINAALTSGRGGKGSVVVFAAGNTDGAAVNYPGSLTQVITVAASNLCDQRKNSSGGACNYNETWGPNSGPQVDVSAPGVGLYTTDIMGTGGYNTAADGNYYHRFNGTSGATPIVSGMVGLVLSHNSNLTAVQVQQLVKDSADDIATTGFDNGTGWGRINARRALEAASANLTVQLSLQGRNASPSSQWVTTVHVQIRPVLSESPMATVDFTSNTSGQFTIPNLPPGSYNVWIKGTHSLARVHTVVLVTGANNLTTDLLLEGDANDDNTIALVDFSALASAFGTSIGQPSYNAQADFNDTDSITINDFSLLATNFGQSGVP